MGSRPVRRSSLRRRPAPREVIAAWLHGAALVAEGVVVGWPLGDGADVAELRVAVKGELHPKPFVPPGKRPLLTL